MVTGVAGMLGSDIQLFFQRKAPESYHTVGITRKDVDLANLELLAEFLSHLKPHIIIHCAAFTDVDGCENQKEKAFLINGKVAECLAKYAQTADTQLLYVSTDYVFSGDKGSPYGEEDPIAPINIYGHSKRAGEVAVLELAGKGAVIRTSWLFGQNGPNFVKTIANKAKTDGKLKVVNDQRGCPTFTVDLAEGIFHLVEAKASGIYHLSNSGECTWFEFAKEIVKEADIENVEIKPVPTKEFPRPAKRPPISILSCEKYNRLTGKPLRHWREALRAYFNTPSPEYNP